MKKAVGAIDNLHRNTRGGGCGCFATGCGVVAIVFLTMCVGSYFMAMHSSIPLAWIEAAIEEDGNVEVEGLRGSISTGFEIDLLRFQSEEFEGEWNELRNVKFSYNGFVNMLRTRRLIIGEASVGSATIFAEIDGGDIEFNGDFNGEEVANEIADEWSDMHREFQGNDSDDLKELRIDLLSATNVVILDPRTGTQLELKKVEFKNYQMLKNKIVSLGDLEIISDQIDLETDKSSRFPDEPVAWNLTGNVKPAAHKSVRKDIPFDIDFAVKGTDKFRLHLKLCEGRVEIDGPYSENRVFRLTEFSHGDYFRMKSELVPSRWNANFTIVPEEYEIPAPLPDPQETPNDQDSANDDESEDDETNENPSRANDSQEEATNESDTNDPAADPPPPTERESNKNRKPRMIKKRKHTVNFEPGCSFVLGETRFEIETKQVVFGPDEGQMEPAHVIANGKRGDQAIQAMITLKGGPPWFAVDLRAEGAEPRDLWAQLFFNKDYVELDSDQKSEVDKTILASRR